MSKVIFSPSPSSHTHVQFFLLSLKLSVNNHVVMGLNFTGHEQKWIYKILYFSIIEGNIYPKYPFRLNAIKWAFPPSFLSEYLSVSGQDRVYRWAPSPRRGATFGACGGHCPCWHPATISPCLIHSISSLISKLHLWVLSSLPFLQGQEGQAQNPFLQCIPALNPIVPTCPHTLVLPIPC